MANTFSKPLVHHVVRKLFHLPTQTFLLQVIEVRFLSFDLEYDANCRWDYVKVYSGPCGGNSPTKYCGTTLPPNLTSTDRKVCLEFFSDPVETRTGFRVQLSRIGNSR